MSNNVVLVSGVQKSGSLIHPRISQTSRVTQIVKNPPAMWETWVGSLGWEDPLEKETTTHSNILACRIPGTEEPDRLQCMWSQGWT